MIFSCLVDADFLDTEAFYAKAVGRVVDRTWPALPAIVGRLIVAFDAHMAEKRKSAAETAVNSVREDVLAHVRDKAAARPGIFTLTVPTGGGKTLADSCGATSLAAKHVTQRAMPAHKHAATPGRRSHWLPRARTAERA